jgi:HAE1 family hydrophobic/amphiphilic exporter-1
VALQGQYGWHELGYGNAAEDGRNWSAGLVMSFPVFDGFRTDGQVRQAESRRSTLAIEKARLRDAVTMEVKIALDRVREAEEIVTALSRTVQQAERLTVMAEKGFSAGVKTRLDVDDAQLNLAAAQGNLARARRDYLVARVALDRATGTLQVPETARAIAIPAVRGSGLFIRD